MAEGLLDTDGVWHPAPEIPSRVLEQLFSAQLLSELTRLGFISADLVTRMQTWKHTGFNADWGRSIPPENRAERESLCQYILRNPFSEAKVTLEHPKDTVIYRSRLNPKINRNFQIFDPVDFLAVLSQHIPDKGVQMIRYYGLYSNKARGIRRKQETSPSIAWPKSTPPPPLKLPKRTWRDLICQAWHSDPLQCPKCQNEMRLIALIEEPLVIEKILRHLSLWCGPPQFAEARSPHGEPVSNPQPIDGDFLIEEQIMPDYENVITD